MALLFDILEQLEHESRNPLYDFGFNIRPEYLHHHVATVPGLTAPRRNHPLYELVPRKVAARRGHGLAKESPSAVIGKDGFQVCLDVAHFKPSELNVKVVDNAIVVEGKHEEREDEHGYIMRHFTRRYNLPTGYEAEKVVSTLSSDGVLTINVPKPLPIEDKSKERVVQIQQVGPAHLNVKANAEEKDKANKAVTNGANAGTGTAGQKK